MDLFKVFSTRNFGVIATLIFHGALLLFFLFTSLDTPPERKVDQKIVPLEDVEVLTEEDMMKMEEREEKVTSEAENTVVNQADEREVSMTDYSQWNKEDVDKEVWENAKKIEREEYEKRREAGYEVPEWKGEEESENDRSSEEESSIDPDDIGEKKYGGVAHVEYYLKDRTHRDLPSPAYVGSQQGKVVINIKVDEFGDVKDVELNENMSTTTDPNLVEIALRYARRARFDFVKDGPGRQHGTITYIFESQ